MKNKGENEWNLTFTKEEKNADRAMKLISDEIRHEKAKTRAENFNIKMNREAERIAAKMDKMDKHITNSRPIREDKSKN